MESPEHVARAIFQAVTDFGLNDEQLRHAKQRIDIYGKECVEEAYRKIRAKITVALGIEARGGILKNPTMAIISENQGAVIPLSSISTRKKEEPAYITNPKGDTWVIFTGEQGSKTPTLTNRPWNLLKGYRLMTPEEAFQPGAVVRWTNSEDFNEIEQGYFKVPLGRDGPYAHTQIVSLLRPISELNLVKPAPEKKV